MSDDYFFPGKIMLTKGVAERMYEDSRFNDFCLCCLGRHLRCDYGDISEDVKALNDEAIKTGLRVVSSYFYNINEYDVIWIITEADRSTTSIFSSLPIDQIFYTAFYTQRNIEIQKEDL